MLSFLMQTATDLEIHRPGDTPTIYVVLRWHVLNFTGPSVPKLPSFVVAINGGNLEENHLLVHEGLEVSGSRHTSCTNQ